MADAQAMTTLPEEAVKAAIDRFESAAIDWGVMEFHGTTPAYIETAHAHLIASRKNLELSILSALEPSAARELALEKADHDLINELSGNPGELIDKMAEAIRDWGSHYDDGPWETLPEDRKAGWRGDAERALAVVKEYLTARRPSEQAVTEAMVEALRNIDAEAPAKEPRDDWTSTDLDEAFYEGKLRGFWEMAVYAREALTAALKSAMEAGR